MSLSIFTTAITNRGFTQKPQEILSSGINRRVLLAEAVEDNNNTNISCKAHNSINIDSNIAVLRIQGELML